MLLPVQFFSGVDTLPQWITLLIVASITEIFFSYFWYNGGQTIGMRAWKIKITQRDGSPLTVFQAMMRFPVNLITLTPLCVSLFLGVDRANQSVGDRWLNLKMCLQAR